MKVCEKKAAAPLKADSYKAEKKLARTLRLRGLRLLLSAELIYKLLTVLAFMPLLRGIWALALRLSPVKYIVSDNMAALLRAPLILAAALLIGILTAVWTPYEFSLILHGLDAGFVGRRCHYKELFTASFADMRHVFLPKNWPMLLVSALLVPFANFFIASSFISQITVPMYIMEVIQDDPRYFALYCAGVAAAVVFLFFGCLSFSYFLLERQDFAHAMRSSRAMIRAHFANAAAALVRYGAATGVKVFCLALAAVLGLLVTVATLGVLDVMKVETMRALELAAASVITPFFGYVLSCYINIINFSIIAALYYTYAGRELRLAGSKREERAMRSGGPVLMAAAAISTLAFSVCFAAAVLAFPDLIEEQQITVTCHRGYSAAAPENTIPAFAAAIEAGADYAELDVQMTKDGVVMVTHDTNLKRCTGTNANIYDLTYEQVRQLDAGSYFGDEFAGTQIPTLDEVIKYCKGKIRLNIEIKQNGHSPRLEAETVRIILDNDFADDCVITSLSYESLSKVKEAAPQLRTGYILAVGVGNYYDLPCADFFSVETTFITSDMVNAIHKRGKTISAWTVDRSADAEKLVALGVDDLITGDPAMAREAIADSRGVLTALYEAALNAASGNPANAEAEEPEEEQSVEEVLDAA